MHITPNDIAASICNDPSIKPADILYKYMANESIIRFKSLKEYFMTFDVTITEDEMIRLMSIKEDILFTEGSDDKGRFWRAAIVPDQQSGPTREGYIDHRITDEFDDSTDLDFDGEEDDFAGRDLAGINSQPEPGQMDDLSTEAPGELNAIDNNSDQSQMPAAADQSQIPPAAIPRAMPNIIAQAMAGQYFSDIEQDQMDTDIPYAQPGPGEEKPTPQTEMSAQMADQQVQFEPDFGDDGADYTIDPFLNALKGVIDKEEIEETELQQSPQSTNEPTTGARTDQNKLYTKSAPRQYSERMREAWEKRNKMISETC